MITSEMTDPLNEKKPLWQIFADSGIEGIQLMDVRTKDILEHYEFYKNAPYKAFDNQVWFESVRLLNRLEPRLF